MTDILKGALGGAWTWLISFVLPATLFLAAIGLTLKAESPDPRLVEQWLSWSSDSQLLVAGLSAVTVGMLLLGLNTALHRILEGHLGIRQVPWLWDRLSQRQIAKRDDLKQRLSALQTTEGDSPGSLRGAFLIEQLMRYPSEATQIGPTRYGNAIRSFESYGATVYGLDSQTLWHEVIASAPESARTEQEGARAYVDMLVNLVFLSVTFAVIALARLILDFTTPRAIALGVGVVMIPIWYRLAVQAVHQWAGTVRALVNLGRKPLAANLDLELPKNHGEEVDMWLQIAWLVREGPDPADPLRKYRNSEDLASDEI